MVNSGDKTKLLTIATSANRRNKLENDLQIEIQNKVTEETSSEKLLGIVVNNLGTWKKHFYGDEENKGLLKELSCRMGMLKKIRKFLPAIRFRALVNGLWFSKLLYGITVWGEVFGVTNEYDEEIRKHIAMTREDLRKMQVAENAVMRMMTGFDYISSTMELLQKSNLLSINQVIAYHTLVQVYNIKSKRLPSYHYRRLFGRLDGEGSTRSVSNHECRIEFSSSQARGLFFYQGGLLWNRIPQQMKNIQNLTLFKKQARRWTLNNILAKP